MGEGVWGILGCSGRSGGADLTEEDIVGLGIREVFLECMIIGWKRKQDFYYCLYCKLNLSMAIGVSWGNPDICS